MLASGYEPGATGQAGNIGSGGADRPGRRWDSGADLAYLHDLKDRGLILVNGRAQLVLADWRDTRRRLTETETRMVAVLDGLGLTGLVTSIDGLTAVGVAAILAEIGDLARFGSPRAVVKHAGLCPRDNSSGQNQGKTSISGKGRPGLRLAAWRAVWGALPNNPVLAAPFTYLTTPRGWIKYGQR